MEIAMTSPLDPFDLLDTDISVVPVLPKTKLSAMVDAAVFHPQIEKTAPRPLAQMRKGRWSGGLAMVACLVLLVTILPVRTDLFVENTPSPAQTVETHSRTTTTLAASGGVTAPAAAQDEDASFDVSAIMFYDTLEGY